MGTRLYRLISKPEGESYDQLVTALLQSAATFGLVWGSQSELEESAHAVHRDLQPFKVRTLKSDRWPGTRLIGGETLLRIYRADDAALPVLLRPGALFAWRRPRFPEDIWFTAADGSLTFASIIHEGDAWIFSRSVAASVANHVTLKLDGRLKPDDPMFRFEG